MKKLKKWIETKESVMFACKSIGILFLLLLVQPGFSTLKAAPRRQPDLIIRGIHCPDTSRHIWKKFHFYITVKNNGTSYARSSKLEIRFQRSRWPGVAMGSVEEVKTFYIPPLRPGGTYRIHTTRRWSRSGRRYVIAIADANRRVFESNEFNNKKELRIRVK